MKQFTTVLIVAALSIVATGPAMAGEFDAIEGQLKSNEEEPSEKKPIRKMGPIGRNKMHMFGSVGYALPVIDLADTGGALPFRLGMHYFLIRNLGIGGKTVFSPVFGVDEGSLFLFNGQGEIIYLTDFGLGIWLSLGITTATATVSNLSGTASIRETEAMFGSAVGISWHLFFNHLYGFEFGAEFDFNASGDGIIMYPLVFFGGKFSIGENRR